MRCIRLNLQGRLNSFRIPLFKSYHKSFLIPPKTTLVGMLTNILGKGEREFYQFLQKDMKVGIVVENIEGYVHDFWIHKSLEEKKGMYGKKPVKRERYYKANYCIYISCPDHNQKLILHALKEPLSIPSLGQDDELVKILSPIFVTIEKRKSTKLNGILCKEDESLNYQVKLIDSSPREIIYPNEYVIATNFKVQFVEDKRSVRIPTEEKTFVEYYNCYIELASPIQTYYDPEKQNHFVLY